MYRLGTVGTGTLSHDLNRWWAMLRGKEDPSLKIGQVNDRTKKNPSHERSKSASRKSDPNYVWALRDINLKVQEGELLGIIGRNGAGKSTLLKLLSRVTAPTTGQIKAKGRIASLLEVGTGFHPELTGRENVYLNGAIMGMTRPEIARQLDEIVEFSGCAKYIDTPVKRYSSGMTVRLGFAVAAHLESEILIVDEVLAVGDFDFQKRCIAKMKQISAGAGRTVLFVSHNLSSIRNLCDKAVLLVHGGIAQTGEVEEVLAAYSKPNENKSLNVDDEGKNGFRFTKLWMEDENGAQLGRRVASGQRCKLFFEYECVSDTIQNIGFRISFLDPFGTRLTQFSSDDFGLKVPPQAKGKLCFRLERFPFAAGTVQINMNAFIDRTWWHCVGNAASLEVDSGDFFGNNVVQKNTQVGPVLIDHEWASS